MHLQEISEADKYLLYGLLLKKRRSRGQERRVMAIIRGTLGLEGRIEALIRLQEEEDRALFVLPGPEAGRARSALSPGQREGTLLVVDAHQDVTRLLRKCSLKRRLSFHRIGESFDAVHLLRGLRARLIVLNEVLPPEDYSRYYEICRVIEPRIRVICLCPAPHGLDCSDAFRKNVRFLPKPINMERLEATATELLDTGA